jgi:alkanesulfonate monooxygenase SsuD/methylene tetrahydromethanopterin reductase-like flavin-dependent oxidoreductase (luciferase family)
VYPPIDPGKKLHVWVGVGGTPKSVARAAHYGLPLMLAIIGGSSRRFVPYVELFSRALSESGKPSLPVGVHSPGHVAASDEEAREQLWPNYQILMSRIGAERGWPPVTRAQFDREAGPDGALYVGSPETVAKKIAVTVRALGLTRFDMKYANGPTPHTQLMTSIELYGTKVAPRVKELLQETKYEVGVPS